MLWEEGAGWGGGGGRGWEDGEVGRYSVICCCRCPVVAADAVGWRRFVQWIVVMCLEDDL